MTSIPKKDISKQSRPGPEAPKAAFDKALQLFVQSNFNGSNTFENHENIFETGAVRANEC